MAERRLEHAPEEEERVHVQQQVEQPAMQEAAASNGKAHSSTVTMTGYHVGAVVAALLGILLIGRFGWQSMFVAGASDWGIRQVPGALERMQREACTDMRGCHLIEGAGHWVQQEQPERTVAHLLDFLSGSGTDSLHR